MKLKLPPNSPIHAPDFVFGAATSAFQIEGAAERRLASIWDKFCATPGKIRDHSNGRVACDHVSRWSEDIEILSELGFDAYRFSVSWPRLLRQDGSINQEGLSFYLGLLDRLNEKGIKPFVTLYHWDLPQHLQDSGGWLNRETAYRFEEYADRTSRAFGSRVHSYATLNEPWSSAFLGYETGVHAPGLTDPAKGKKAAHHLLLAHGLALRALRTNSPDTLNGIVLNFTPFYGASDADSDQLAARLADDTDNHWYLGPLLEGAYPQLIDSLPKEHLPDIVEGDLDLMQQPLDFLGVNEQRTDYIQQHLLAVERAVHRGVEVAGYFYWSLLDNFEWAEGYAKRFGLVYVDYATKERTIKASGNAFRDFLHARPFRRAKNHLQGCSIS